VKFESTESPIPFSLDEESQLIKQAQAGDGDAFSRLYRTYVQSVYRYLVIRLSNAQVAEDLTGEVFLRVVDGLPRYTHRGFPFGAWVFRIARDRLVDYYRQTARRPTTELGENLFSELPDPSALVETQDAQHSLQVALQQLTDEQRRVIQFRFMEDWSLADTAIAMNRSVNAIKALQHRALGSLSRLMTSSKATDD